MMNKGFTLIELLLTVALFSVVAGMSLPISYTWITNNDATILTATIAQSLRRAQILAQSGMEDGAWGLYIDADANKLTIFQGQDYVSREVVSDEIFDFSPNVSISGLNEIVFSKQTGEPSATGDIIVSTSQNDDHNISINEAGLVSY